MKKTAVVALILICLMALGAVCSQPIRAEYPGNIIINADGSVSPSTAPIQQTGDTYTLTDDVVGSITVMRSNVVFDGNGHVISGGNIGIDLSGVSNVTITNNTIAGTSALPFMPTAGIAVNDGSSNIISGNNFENDMVGISLTSWDGKSLHNLIEGNNFTGCSIVFLLYDSSNNTIYHNNFANNTNTVEDTGYLGYGIVSLNIWDDGYLGGGNYWSDYKTRYPNAKMLDDSGIGDTPYFVMPKGFMDSSASSYWNRLNAIELNNTDRYPLMEPFGIFYVMATTPPKISLLSPLKRTYNESSLPLIFKVDKIVNWTGYTLDGKQNITIIGNSTTANMTNGLHSITVYANDTFGNMGASETVSFTIAKPEPFPTATVAAVSGVVAVVVVAALLVYFKKRKR